ncbi:hypothetical protein PCASD_08295 [Puccinia coronata f. sp. avenae]|uniref:Zinc finger Mcm10/DnaG-type domain-containing protein n=1 Tax=Puccinia coronata f. sp. avenae TaxID=200324 RepID=A0A2N5V179_9BASI|nr:hypothetical protein PCASD_08295 [Puccinia coronata f. sp. avenae]
MISSINPIKPPHLNEKRQKAIESIVERNPREPKKEPPSRSTLVEGLSDLRKESKKQTLIQESKRSNSFSSRPVRPVEPPEELRASDLTVKVKIPLGPIAHEPSSRDPEFLQIEPNSLTRLKKRSLSHQLLQDYLSDRHIVRINELYAIIRKAEVSRFQGGTEWKVPLVGDWVLFGVIGQKSDFKTTSPYIASQYNRMMNNKHQEENTNQPQASTSNPKNAEEGEEEDVKDDLNEELQRDDQSKKKGKTTETVAEEVKPKQKKFVTFKLIDMSSNKISSSGSGVINMILFEADCEVSNGEEGTQKIYRGGSGGAYEKFWKEQPGSLIAILNPKVLKNRAQSISSYRPKTDILSITPENQQSIMVIGRSKDIGSCVAKRLDSGKPCGDWCDLRNCGSDGSDALAICDFHLQRQVQKVRAGRAEFFSGTSGMNQHTGKSFSQSYVRKGTKTDKCDPSTKTGLLAPSQSKRTTINGQVTYICGGNRSSSNDVNRNSRSKSFEDRYSRPVDTEKVEGMKLKRKRELEEIQMNKILTDQKEKNDSYGYKCIQDAKRALKKSHHPESSRKTLTEAKKQVIAPEEKTLISGSSSSGHKSIYSTAAIRAIGFDPTHHAPNGCRAGQVDPHTSHQNHSSSAYHDLLERCPQQPERKVLKLSQKPDGKEREIRADDAENDCRASSGDEEHESSHLHSPQLLAPRSPIDHVVHSDEEEEDDLIICD